MAYTRDYDDLDYGDEVRGEALQTVGLPHDEETDGIPVGAVVSMDGDVIKPAPAGEEVGVLYAYQVAGEGTPSDPAPVRQDRKATVAVGGKLKVQVGSGVSAGDQLESDGSGTLVSAAAGTHSGYVALSAARPQDNDNPNGSGGEHYAEVLLR